MGIRTTLYNLLVPPERRAVVKPNRRHVNRAIPLPSDSATATPRQVARVTMDSSYLWSGNTAYILPPPDPEGQWHFEQLDSETLSRMSAPNLLKLVVDLSPETSKALWDWLRFCNPGYEVDAFRPGTETTDRNAQTAIDGFIARLNELYGSFDVIISRLFIGPFLYGSVLAELVLDEQGQPVDLAVPDPSTVRFRLDTDPVRGQYWAAGQLQATRMFVPFDRPTIRYIPVDPMPGNPYGRSLIGPALFSALFLLGILHDLKRVVQQQGYPRLDIAIKLKELTEAMPLRIQNNEVEWRNWVEKAVSDVQSSFSQLRPDSTYVHTDNIEVNRPVGTVDSSSLGAIDPLMRTIERMITRGLKSMPLLMGSNEAVSETHANRQWEIHVASIKAIQHIVESLLEDLLKVMLEAQGIAADVRFRFSELRAAELLRDAQVEQLQIANANALYYAGIIDQDERADKLIGRKPAEEEPLATPQGYTLNPTPEEKAANLAAQQAIAAGQANQPNGQANQQDGTEPTTAASDAAQAGDTNKAIAILDVQERAARTKPVTPTGSGFPLPAIPETVDVAESEIERALNEWDYRVPDYAGLLDARVITEAQ